MLKQAPAEKNAAVSTENACPGEKSHMAISAAGNSHPIFFMQNAIAGDIAERIMRLRMYQN